MRFGGNTALSRAGRSTPRPSGTSSAWRPTRCQRFGGLNDEMLRAMRLVVDTGIHAKGWTREQAIQYMLDNSGMSETEVTAEVERYIAIPGQALAYKIGQLKILELRAPRRSGARPPLRPQGVPRPGADDRRAAADRARAQDRRLDRGAAAGGLRRVMAGRSQTPLWTCPACGRAFANRNQSHACGRHDLDAHFEGRSAKVRAIYEAFLAMLESFGPVVVLPEKTRIAFQVRMSFAQLTIRRGRGARPPRPRPARGRPGLHPGRNLLAPQPPPPLPSRHAGGGRTAAGLRPRGLCGGAAGASRRRASASAISLRLLAIP